MGFSNTVIKVIAAGCAFDNQFLQVSRSVNDALIGFTPHQNEATKFDVPECSGAVCPGFTPSGGSALNGEQLVIFTDTLGPSQPLLVSTKSEHDQQAPFVDQVSCRVDSDSTMTCQAGNWGAHNSPPSPMYNREFAICQNRLGYGRGALFQYNKESGLPKDCFDAQMKVLNA